MLKVLSKFFGFLKTNITIVIIVFLFAFLIVVDNIKTQIANDIINNFKVVASSFSPKTGIFSDNDDISYVSYVFNILSPTKEISFVKPSKNPSMYEGEYEIVYNYTGLIFSSSDGIVKSVGFVEDEKYIEIVHSNGYTTKYIGVETLGVCANEQVKKNQALAMLKEDRECRFILFKDNQKIKIGEVKWEK